MGLPQVLLFDSTIPTAGLSAYNPLWRRSKTLPKSKLG